MRQPWSNCPLDKPLVGFIAGVSAPPGRRMGHDGTIICGESDTAEAKMVRMEEFGVHVVRNPAHIGKTVNRVMSESCFRIRKGKTDQHPNP